MVLDIVLLLRHCFLGAMTTQRINPLTRHMFFLASLNCPCPSPTRTTSGISRHCIATYARRAWNTSRQLTAMPRPRDGRLWYLRAGLVCVVPFASTCLVISRRPRPVSSRMYLFLPTFMHVLFSFHHFHLHFPLHVPASFPNQISSIYSSVVMLQCRHFPNCREMPDSVREHLEALKKAGNATPNSCGTKRRDFWSDSALSMGFVDTDAGVQYVPRVADNLSSEMSSHDFEEVACPSTNEIDFSPESNAVGLPRLNFVSPCEHIAASRDFITFEQFVSGSTLVTLEDRDLVPDYVFLSLAQLAPCQLIAADRIGAYRARPIGFTGMCCRYCQGCQPGPGESTRVVLFYSAEKDSQIPRNF